MIAYCVTAPYVQIPMEFPAEEVKERLRKLQGGPQLPLTVHLRQEIDCLNVVVKLAKTTLSSLRLAIAGTCLHCFRTVCKLFL